MERLASREDFRRVYACGQLQYGRYVVVTALPVDEQPVREIVREVAHLLTPGYHIVVGAKRTSACASFAE